MRDLLTVLVLTFNEAPNIERTLRSVDWAKEVLVVDSFSTDATLELARATHENVRALQHSFQTHTAQWNFGLDQIDTPWVLSLDADYELSADLATEIQSLSPADALAAYAARFQYRVYGRALRSSVYPPRSVLFRRDRCRYAEEGHTQLLKANGKVEMLRGLIYHDDRKPLSRWLQSQDNYMIIEAKHLLTTKTQELRVPDRIRRLVFAAPPVIFLYLLFVRGLFLDGWRGWYYVAQRTLAEMLLSLRLLTIRHDLEPKARGDY